MTDSDSEGINEGYVPVARIIDRPLGVGVEWLAGVSYDDDPRLDDGVILYIKAPHSRQDDAR